MKYLTNIVSIFLISFMGQLADASWTAKVDYSSCPRQYIPSTSGEEGGFASETDCRSRVEAVKRSQVLKCAVYSCKSVESGGDSTAPAAGHEMDKHIGDAISAGITGDISASDAVGLATLGLIGNALLTPATPETPDQIATRLNNERVWAENQARANEAARLREAAYQADQDSKSLAFLDLAATEFKTENSELSKAFSKGFEHSSSCISQNSGPACSGLSASQQTTCIADYRAGYDAGMKKQNLILQEAFQEGQRAGAKGERLNGAASPNATGPCRIEWIKHYDRGHYAGKQPKAKL